MTKVNPLLNNCKPHRVHLKKEKATELSLGIDELLETSASQRVISYQEALRMIKQFTYIIKDCNYMIEPKN
ncbi:MAG: hypothetical protein ACFE9D_12240 [Promethearchaeota archaeon]